MIAQRTLDVGYCLKILSDPEIFDSISEDGASYKDLKIDVREQYWIEVLDGEIEIGVMQLKQMFSNCWDLHIHILPEHRKKYSQKAGLKFWGWIEENLKDCLIYANIPTICPNVRKFTESFGFKQTGFLEGAFTKNSKRHDMWIFTRRVEQCQQQQ